MVREVYRTYGLCHYSNEGAGRGISLAFYLGRYAFYGRAVHPAGKQGNTSLCRTYPPYVRNGAGLAAYGYKPIVVTFAPFATRRVCDQIAVSVAYAKQNVKIVGTDPGITAELNGGTHMSFEDIATLRSIPTMTIYDAVGGFSNRNKKVIEVYAMNFEIPEYINIINRIDPKAFVVITKVKTIRGNYVQRTVI